MRRRRVAIVCDLRFWVPTFGSHTRVRNLADSLSQDFDVSILYLGAVSHLERAQARRAVNAEVYFGCDYPEVAETDVQIDREDGWPEDFAVFGFQARRFVEMWQADAVIVEYIKLSYIRPFVCHTARVLLDALDVMSQRVLSFHTFGKRPRVTISAADEAATLSAFDAVMAISAADGGAMRHDLGLTNVIVTPVATGIAVEAREIRPAVDGKLTALFVAGDSETNTAALGLLHAIWPAIADDFRLDIVGGVHASVFAGVEDVRILGYVDDIEQVYASADVAVNPVFMGGGLKIKVVEAMGYGLPCVTSVEGARGLEDAAPEALVVAESALEFIAQMKRLTDMTHRRRLSKAALDYARTRFSSSTVMGDLKLFLSHA